MTITTTWTGAGDGTSWNDPKNWDNGVPNSSTDATIENVTSTFIQVTNKDEVNSLTLQSANLEIQFGGELDIASTLDAAGGELFNAGLLSVTGGTIDLTDTFFGNFDPASAPETLASGHFSLSGPATMILPELFPSSIVSTLQSDVTLIANDPNAQPVLEGFDSSGNFVTLQQSLTTIGSFGTLDVSGFDVVLSNAVVNHGDILLGSAGGPTTLDDVGLDNENTVEGAGTVLHDLVNNGTIQADNFGAPLILAGAITGTGQFEIASQAVLEIEGPMSQEVTASQGATLILDDPISFNGNIDLDGSDVTIVLRNLKNVADVEVPFGQIVVTFDNGDTLVFPLGGDTTGLRVALGDVKTVWKGPSAANRSGDFNVAANWSRGTVPTTGFGTEPLLGGAGSYTVTSFESNTVDALRIRDAGATLAVAAGTFDVLESIVNAGQITVAAEATLESGGVINTTGSISLQSTFQGAATLVVAGGRSDFLQGGGTITMGSGAQIVSDGTTTRLVNDDAISGSGTIGDAAMTLVNNGTIAAAGNGAGLTIAAGLLLNRGLIEATSDTLVIQSGVANVGGTILAAGHESISINSGVSGNGGTIEIAGGAVFVGAQVAQGQTIKFDTGTTGTLLLDDAEQFKGTVTNFALNDAIDLFDFAFANGPTIAVSGSDTAGGITRVKITDGALVAKIALLNQYDGEFSTNRSAYQLSNNIGGTPGTVFELASPTV